MKRCRLAIFSMLAALSLSACDALENSAPAPSQAAAGESGDVQPAQKGDPKTGAFDFYVLSLSWSPTYCLEQGGEADPLQCGAEQPFDFVVHGLWPQTEAGPLDDCPEVDARPSAQLVNSMLDIMPSTGLVRHQWNAHGACSGLSPKNYFAAVRKARAAVEIPDAFKRQTEAGRLTPADIEAMFIEKNTGLSAEGIAVKCAGKRLDEVRICLTKSLTFRTCSEVDRRGCRRYEIIAPVWRGR